MRLSTFSDYSLRVLMHLGAQPDVRCNIADIATRHGISQNHLMKVVLELGRAGYVRTIRGKGGGLTLGKAAAEIVIGDVLRVTETDFALAECLGDGATCRIQGGCRLKAILNETTKAMFLVLDSYTLADLLEDPAALLPGDPGDQATRPAR